MVSLKNGSVFNLFFRIWIGLIFAYAGYSKLMEPIENFRGSLAEYQVIPYAWLTFVSLTVPWVEFISGIFMILGLALPMTALVQAGMCLCFLTVMGSSHILLDSINKECGCFGLTSPIRLTLWQVFIMDFINFVIALKLFNEKKTILSLDGFLGKTAVPSRTSSSSGHRNDT